MESGSAEATKPAFETCGVSRAAEDGDGEVVCRRPRGHAGQHNTNPDCEASGCDQPAAGVWAKFCERHSADPRAHVPQPQEAPVSTGKQKQLAGMEDKNDPQLDIFVEGFEKASTAHGKAGKRVQETEAALLAYMQEHKLKAYRTADGTVVKLVAGKIRAKLEQQKSGPEKDEKD
jgi:hypothetical protein